MKYQNYQLGLRNVVIGFVIIFQVVPVLISDLTRNSVKATFLALRQQAVLVTNGVNDEHENLNVIQSTIKSIGDGVDDFLEKNFNALIHPVDTLYASLRNIINMSISFLKLLINGR